MAPFGMYVTLAFLVVGIVTVTAQNYERRRSNRYIQTDKDWYFLDSWVFRTGNVRFNYNITFSRAYSPMKFLFYQKNQYYRAIDGAKNCEEKVGELQGSDSVPNQILNLSDRVSSSGCMGSFNNPDSLVCTGRVVIRVNRGMEWFVVANRCLNPTNRNKGMRFNYWIENYEERPINQIPINQFPTNQFPTNQIPTNQMTMNPRPDNQRPRENRNQLQLPRLTLPKIPGLPDLNFPFISGGSQVMMSTLTLVFPVLMVALKLA